MVITIPMSYKCAFGSLILIEISFFFKFKLSINQILCVFVSDCSKAFVLVQNWMWRCLAFDIL